MKSPKFIEDLSTKFKLFIKVLKSRGDSQIDDLVSLKLVGNLEDIESLKTYIDNKNPDME
jgi:hypothetical protein